MIQDNNINVLNNNDININESMMPQKKNNKVIILIIMAITIIFIGIGTYIGLKAINSNKQKQTKENNYIELSDENLFADNYLQTDFESGILSVDEYVTQSIYRVFNKDKANSKYANSYVSSVFSYDEYIDQMSDETLKLYYDAINLSNVKFVEDNSKVAVQLSNEDNGENQIQSLNKVYLSKSGKFMLWYTDTGDNKMSLNQIMHDADLFDDAVIKYQEYLGLEFKYYALINTKSDRYKVQTKILENNNIEEKYLSEAMQVYYINIDADGIYSHNSYFENKPIRKKIDNTINSDTLTIANKYILINPSNNSRSKDDAVIYHELFHHYEFYCINNDGQKAAENYNDMFGEAASQWAAAKFVENNTQDNLLNIFNSNYNSYLYKIFTYGYNEYKNQIGYAIFNLVESLEKNNQLGKELIINAIYKDEPFEYINSNMTREQRNAAIKELAIHMLNQDFSNKNYLLYINDKIKFPKTITEDSKEKDYISISEAGIYYMDYTPKDKEYLKLSIYPEYYDENNQWTSVYLLGLKDNKYELIESHEYEDKTIFKLSDYKNYNKVVIAVINNDLNKNHNFDLRITKDEITETSYENYKVKIDTTVSVLGIDTISHMEGIVDELHQKEYLKTETEVMGVSLSIESYVDFTNNTTYINNPYTGKWEKSQNTSSKIDISYFVNKLLSMEEVKEIEKNKYSIKLNKEELSMISGDNTLQEYSFKGNIYITVYTNDNKISKLEYDFSDIIDEVDLMKTTIEFYDYNNAGSVEIPNKIKNSL